MLYFTKYNSSLGAPMRFMAEMGMTCAVRRQPVKGFAAQRLLAATSELTIRLSDQGVSQAPVRYPYRSALMATHMPSKKRSPETVLPVAPFQQGRRQVSRASCWWRHSWSSCQPAAQKDTVRSLVQDHEVFITDWRDARLSGCRRASSILMTMSRTSWSAHAYAGTEVFVMSVY